uniref:ATP-dependent DNA helicase n=1 Tax=Brachionus koreanus TaxID=1199090 RepID=A0A7G7WNH9_9BILA|nr:ATP-dependent DNA helicase Q1 [Brachionus koreanus]
MSIEEKVDINSELKQIDKRLNQIREEISLLESERDVLLSRKKVCSNKLKDLMPSSSGGNNTDLTIDWNRTDFEWSQDARKNLKETFKLENFRPLQLETINVTLSKIDCLVIMPTGGGKSLCFQLPALIDTGLTLVVSPLVSLMEDQLWLLKSLNINADTLNSTSSKDHVTKIHSQMLDNKSSLKILYVTPEKLAKSKIFMNKLQKMYEAGRFKRLVVDEVHCCSTYGHDFRPDYKFLGVMKQVFPNICILGLTATATQSVIDDVKKILSIPKCVLFKASFNRPNLFYEIKQKPSSHEEFINELATLIKKKFSQQSGIVYCFSQKESSQVAIDLCSRGIKAGCYHASMDALERSKVHEKWLKNQVHVIVATIAFGMGIDKQDCRFVIHHSLSKSLENFYQESGRAGRDGKTAHSILFFRFADVFRQSTMVFTEQTGLENLYSIVNYCIDKKTCKRILIAKHFNDDVWEKNGDCNQMCDHCKDTNSNQIEKIDVFEEACFVLSVLENTKSDKKLTSNKLAELVYSGIVSKNKKSNYYPNNLNQTEVENLILTMLMNSYLKEDFHFTPYNTICYVVAGPLSKHLRNDSCFYIDRTSSHSSKAASIEKLAKPELAEKNESKELKTRKRNLDMNASSDSCELIFDQNNSEIMPKSKKVLW